jgi:hypothetical protein
MTLAEFRTTLHRVEPPPEIAPALRALWHDARGDWSTAHRIAQDTHDETGFWVHAYLHRKEGDLGNAGYWYRRALKPTATDSLAEEWERIAVALLEYL